MGVVEGENSGWIMIYSEGRAGSMYRPIECGLQEKERSQSRLQCWESELLSE